MTNILIEGYKHAPTYDMVVRDFNKLSKILPISVREKLTRKITPKDIEWCDVLIDVRGNNELSAYVVRECSKIGKKIVLLLDDDLLEYHPQGMTFQQRLFDKSLIDVINTADYMITSSRYLGRKYHQRYGIKYVIMDTIVEESQFVHDKDMNSGSNVKLLYAANRHHREYFNEFITPILDSLGKRYGDRVSLTIIGPDIDIAGISLNIDTLSPMPFVQYREYMNLNHFDIGLAPLPDSEFGRSKYYNKFLEYTTNSICGIYSKVEPYTLIVEDGRNGFFADNTPQSWYETICRAIDEEEKRRTCVYNARIEVLSGFGKEGVAQNLLEQMPDIFSFNSPSSDKGICKYMYGRFVYSIISRKINSLL